MLQENAQRKGLPMPEYNTNYTGPPNDRVFQSTVKVCLSVIECKSFEGNCKRTKRDECSINGVELLEIVKVQNEMSAALMALNYLKL